MANVTYLLGAGASYNALPIIDEISDAIKITRGVLSEIRRSINMRFVDRDYDNFTLRRDPIFQNLLAIAENDLLILQKGCESHLSIDTYLKMLYLTGNGNYEKMKATIVLFFCLYHCLNSQNLRFNKEKSKKIIVDKRYDAFFASILQDKHDVFPNNINIISWNYDNQFERAYNTYLINSGTSKTADEVLNIYHKNGNNQNFNSNSFCIYKINGTASYFDTNHNLLPQSCMEDIDTNATLRRILLEYSECLNGKSRSAISFAWDSKEVTNSLVDIISETIKKTEVLVIIGYSMPFFNRNIDKELLKRGKLDKLKHIYVQDINSKDIIERIKGIRPDIDSYLGSYNYVDKTPITPITNLKQFHLPNEL